MSDFIKALIEKQISQLDKTFEYLFRRYMFMEGKEDMYSKVNRPKSIVFNNQDMRLIEVEQPEEAEIPNLEFRLTKVC